MISEIEISSFFETLSVSLFSGVPCSHLQPLIDYAAASPTFTMAANEGDAVAFAAGSWLGGQHAAVFMQNSGLGNAVSPLTSLTRTFQIPVLGFISLRGEPDTIDEPQHALMGEITGDLLKSMCIDYADLASDQHDLTAYIESIIQRRRDRKDFFFITRKGTFTSSTGVTTERLSSKTVTIAGRHGTIDSMTRVAALESILASIPQTAALIATTGFTARELYTLQDRAANFYMVGSMGCASSLALGIALAQPERKVIVLDGDGALLMRAGNLAMIGNRSPKNLLHIVLQNGQHESTGGQITTAPSFDFTGAAIAAGYSQVYFIHSRAEITAALGNWFTQPACCFMTIPIIAGTIAKLGRPTISPPDIALRFREYFTKTANG